MSALERKSPPCLRAPSRAIGRSRVRIRDAAPPQLIPEAGLHKQDLTRPSRSPASRATNTGNDKLLTSAAPHQASRTLDCPLVSTDESTTRAAHEGVGRRRLGSAWTTARSYKASCQLRPLRCCSSTCRNDWPRSARVVRGHASHTAFSCTSMAASWCAKALWR